MLLNAERKIKDSILFSLSLLIMGIAVLSAEPIEGTTLENKFRQANESYSQGEYEKAIGRYEELLGIIGPSADLYYNLGCAALKAGRLGGAVVNFHRAARLRPRDEDIKANLKFVEALTKSESDEEIGEENLLFSFLIRWLFLLTETELAVMQLVFLFIFTAGATFLVIGLSGTLRKTALAAAGAGLVFLLLNSVLLGIHIYRNNFVREAVVVEANAEARSGPGEDNTRVLLLPEGTLLRVRQQRSGWVLVSLPSGRSGWLNGDKLEEIRGGGIN